MKSFGCMHGCISCVQTYRQVVKLSNAVSDLFLLLLYWYVTRFALRDEVPMARD